MSPSKRFPFSSRSAAKRNVKLGKTNSPLFHKYIPEFGRHDDTGGKIVQFCVLHRRLVVDSPVHSVPPLAACCKIVLDPLSVPPPHVLVHVPQLHALHSQLAQAASEQTTSRPSPASTKPFPFLLAYFQVRVILP